MDKTDLTRRRFLKGVSTGVVGTLITSVSDGPSLGAAGETAVEYAEGRILGPGQVIVTLNVNGLDRKVAVEPRATLLDTLREKLKLTGAKRVCDRGECGACTVIMDGDPVYACLILAVAAHGRKIETIESLRRGQELHPIQQSFLDNDAMQCGFCTPGQILSAKALLDRNPRPGRDEIRKGMCGNLCRCGAYPKILKAVEQAGSGS